MLEGVCPPRERGEHIGELTDQMLQLLLLGSRQVAVDVNNHGVSGGQSGQLGPSPDPG